MVVEQQALYPRGTYEIQFNRAQGAAECRIVNLHTGALFRACSAWDMVGCMENDLSDSKFPQSAVQYRSWGIPPCRCSLDGPNQNGGKGGLPQGPPGPTFVVKVLFRQHATWQGTVQWIEGRQYRQFRSLNELLALMGEALAAPSAGPD